jgi:hypothetical protein
MMSRRSVGFVGRYLSLTAAGSYLERDRREIWERVQIGMLPAMRSGSGEMIVLVAMVGSIDRRVHEHD